LPPKIGHEQIADGLNDEAREYGAYVIGGDTNECEVLVIASYLFGVARCCMIARRSGARLGDLVKATGEFGNTLAGLKFLSSKAEIPPSLRETLPANVYVHTGRADKVPAWPNIDSRMKQLRFS